MGVLEDFYGYDLFGGANEELASLFKEESLLRARDFFVVHGEHGGLEPWYFLDKMNLYSTILEDGRDLSGLMREEPRGILLRDRSSALFLAHDTIDGVCPGDHDECPAYDAVFELLNVLFYLVEQIADESKDVIAKFVGGLYRSFDMIASEDTGSFFEIFKLFVFSWESDMNAKGKDAVKHFQSLCDTYENMSPEDREGIAPEILINLTRQ